MATGMRDVMIETEATAEMTVEITVKGEMISMTDEKETIGMITEEMESVETNVETTAEMTVETTEEMTIEEVMTTVGIIEIIKTWIEETGIITTGVIIKTTGDNMIQEIRGIETIEIGLDKTETLNNHLLENSSLFLMTMTSNKIFARMGNSRDQDA